MLLEPAPVVKKVPALLNVPVVPPFRVIPFPLLFTSVQVDPARLLITAPFCRNSTLVVPKAVAPETFSVRVSRNDWPEGMLIPPLALVVPVPFMVPPVQVNKPVTVTLLFPVSAPEERVSAEVVAVPPTLLKFAVPPLM